MAEFEGKPAIHIISDFTAANASWEEAIVKLDISHLDIQDYDSFGMEEYYETADTAPEFNVGLAITECYPFETKMDELNKEMTAYTMAVAEGVDGTENREKISTILAEIQENIPKYITDGSQEQAVKAIEAKIAVYKRMREMDADLISLKKENNELDQNLTMITDAIKEDVNEETEAMKKTMNTMIYVILAIGVLVLSIVVGSVVAKFRKSIREFSHTLEEIIKGNLTVRADIKSKDEFSVFEGMLNQFLDKISAVLSNVQNQSNKVSQQICNTVIKYDRACKW